MSETGLMHLYIGDGKGKTTAAVGLLVRAAGAGLRPLLVQFLKGQDSAELTSLKALGILVRRTDDVKKFIPYMDEGELASCRDSHAACFAFAQDAILSGNYDVVALDEVLDAVGTGMVAEADLVELLRGRPAHVEVILTGRNPSDELRGLADYISDIHAVKHPYTRGVLARKGVDY